MTDHGHFTADGREYVITTPFTPRPWHTMLFNDTYLANLTQVGTGASFWQQTGEGLRTNLTEDRDGNGGPRFVYLRDRDSGEFWSLTGAPSFPAFDNWECRVGLGYQVHTTERLGILASWRIFVPEDLPGECWTLTVTNRSDRPRRISLFPYLEMHLTGGSTLMDFIAVLGGTYDPAAHAVFGINSCVKFPPRFKAFLASDRRPDAATVSRDEFLGPYRDYHRPLAVERGDVHNPEAGTEWLGASLRHDLDLAPGETATVQCLDGIVQSLDEGRELIRAWLAPGRIDAAFADLQSRNDTLVGGVTVETGDAQFDRWMNVWMKHQLRFVARWGRVIGRGFRDILQDTFAHRITEPDRARACLLEVFARQFPDGRCIRAWRLPHGLLDLQHYADSPSWMIMALSFYLKETADFGILEATAPYLNPDDPYAEPTSSGTVWEHVVLAQRHLLADRGAHGLSKIHYGDWCDTMNGVGARDRGESVMLSMQVVWGCGLLAELADRVGRPEMAEEMRAGGRELREAVRTHAWDGGWWRRAFDDDGLPVGSADTQPGDRGEGRVFLNPQSWAAIAGISTPEELETSFAAAREHLDTGYGMILHAPPFTGLVPRIGQMTAMTPGFYENGSVYVHGNCFWMYALAVTGRGEEAWQALRAVLPDTANKPNGDTEPFTVPNYYIGPAASRRKQRNLYLSGWRTGSASWMFMTGLEGLCGVRAEYDGLVMDPHLPDGWDQAKVRRPFRGDVYEIEIRRTGPGTSVAVRLDGDPVPGNLVRPVGDGATHRIVVDVG